MNIKIITDSACDLPADIIKRYQIDVLPFIINLKGEEYFDGVDLKPEGLSESIRQGGVPSTSQVPPDLFYKTFEKFLSQGIDCLYIGFSSKMSGTFQTGKLIADKLSETYRDVTVQTVDSLSGSLAQGLLVLEAARQSEQGYKLSEIVSNITKQVSRVEHIFTIDDLKYLYRGGRLKLASAWVGTVLNVKPILQVSDGEIYPLEKQRGNKKVMKRIVDLVNQKGRDLENQTIGITHADDEKKADQIQDMLKNGTACKDFIINRIGCVLSAHLGVGGVGVFFKNR